MWNQRLFDVIWFTGRYLLYLCLIINAVDILNLCRHSYISVDILISLYTFLYLCRHSYISVDILISLYTFLYLCRHS